MKTRVHIGISVSNLEASKQFYRDLFGVEPSKVRDDYANWRLDTPAIHLALTHDPKVRRAQPHERHYGIELFDMNELNIWQTRLQKLGMPLKIEEQVTCCYAVGNKFWAQDPDGNDWEFWVRTSEAASMHAGAEDGQCCTPAGKAEAAAMGALPGARAKEGACCTPATVEAKTGAVSGSGGCCA